MAFTNLNLYKLKSWSKWINSSNGKATINYSTLIRYPLIVLASRFKDHSLYPSLGHKLTILILPPPVKRSLTKDLSPKPISTITLTTHFSSSIRPRGLAIWDTRVVANNIRIELCLFLIHQLAVCPSTRSQRVNSDWGASLSFRMKWFCLCGMINCSLSSAHINNRG